VDVTSLTILAAWAWLQRSLTCTFPPETGRSLPRQGAPLLRSGTIAHPGLDVPRGSRRNRFRNGCPVAL